MWGPKLAPASLKRGCRRSSPGMRLPDRSADAMISWRSFAACQRSAGRHLLLPAGRFG